MPRWVEVETREYIKDLNKKIEEPTTSVSTAPRIG